MTLKNSGLYLIAGVAATVALATTLNAAFLAPPQGGGRAAPACGGNSPTKTPCPEHVAAMTAALPATAPATPLKPRKILVLGNAQGFVHSSIPLAGATVEALGNKTKAWTTTITYNPADINTENLKQYDAIFLASTTGCFLDAVPGQPPASKAEVDARRAALLTFVRSGKGLAGIHAATDSYHSPCPNDAPAGGGRGAGDQNAQTVARGSVKLPAEGSWPEFNKMIGGYFKFHWGDGTHVPVKIDDPKSPLTKMFGGQGFEIVDETYTFAQDSFSRENVHVLTSVDYDKMPQTTKDMEPAATARTDGDYALSYIRREGQGRVFYEANGHNEKVYAIPAMLEHVLAGIQYALGDLKADDSPSVKPKGAAGKQ